MRATLIVHWPGQDTRACERHFVQLVGLARTLGFGLSITPCEPDIECANCANEKAKLPPFAELCSEP